MKKYLTKLVYGLAALLVLGVIGMFALPPLLKSYVEKTASSSLKREVTLGNWSFNPFLLTLELEQLRVKDRYGDFFVAQAIFLDAELMSLIRGGPVLREIRLLGPRLYLVRLDERKFNFSDLLPPPSEKTPSAEALRFALNNIQIEQGQLVLDDRFARSKHTVDQLKLALPFISNLPQRIDEYIAPALSGRINGQAFALKGQSKPFKESLDTSLRLSLEGIDITRYLGYTPVPDPLNISRGRLSSQLDIIFRQEKDQAKLLLAGVLRLEALQLKLDKQESFSLARLELQLAESAPLLNQFHVQKMTVDGLDVLLERQAQGLLNWQQLLLSTDSHRDNAVASRRDTAVSAEQPALLRIDQFSLINSALTWRDLAVQPQFEQRFYPLSLSGQNWSTDSKNAFPVNLRTGVGRDAELSLALKVAMQPVQITGEASVSKLSLAEFAPYYAPFLAAGLTGSLGSRAELFWQPSPLQYQLKRGEVTLDQFTLKPKQGAQIAAIEHISVGGIELDSQTRQLNVANVQSRQGQISLALLPKQQLNVMALLPKQPVSKSASQMQAPWRVTLADAQFDNYTVRIEDRNLSQPTPVVFRQIDLNVKNIGTQTGAQSQLSLTTRAGKQANIQIKGPFTMLPFAAQWQIDARGVDAAYLQPYFSRFINISLASGFVDARGKLTLATAPRFGGSYQGELGVRQFYALDKSTGEDFLKWKSLLLTGLSSQFSPPKVDIAQIRLDNYFSRLILSPNGRMNLQDILVQDAGEASVTRESTLPRPKPVQASSAAPVAETLVPIRIGKMVLNEGNIRYSDLLIRPNFTANLTRMGGVISGISSKNDTRATLDLKGSVDNIAPVQIQGTLNPLAKDVFFDLKGGVKGYELTAASTYAEKYAGYGISKGKLSMDVAYFIEGGKLKASNSLFLDQLTLGDEKTDSPEATNLPVKFALSLLTDRRGQIKLNLPIEGSLDDPQFRVGAIIWQVIGNLLEKIVTAPFDALASAFSDGPSLSYLTFESGSPRLNEGARAAIKQIAAMLEDRPALKLEVSAWADLAQDGDGIRQHLLRQKMRAIKASKLGANAESLESETEVAITEAEQPELIAAVYKQSKFEKPSNMLGLNKKIPFDEMRALILKNIVVSEQDLLALANLRAKRVETALKEAGLAGERIFIVKPQINPPASLTEKDQGPVSRVQFKLE